MDKLQFLVLICISTTGIRSSWKVKQELMEIKNFCLHARCFHIVLDVVPNATS